MGLVFAGTTVVNFNWFIEMFSKRFQSKVIALCFINNRFFTLLTLAYFRYWSKSWLHWNSVAIAMQCFVVITSIWLPESPDFFYAKGRYEESKQVLIGIAKCNGVDVTVNQLKFDE